MKRNDTHIKTDDGKDRKAGSDFLSLGINMTGRRCLVVGGGNIGTRKAAILQTAGAEITVVSPRISPTLLALAKVGNGIAWLNRKYRSSDLHGVFLVVVATSDTLLNSDIAKAAKDRGILCCMVSSATDSTVLFPAVCFRDGIIVAVHSNGRDCRRSKRIRDELSQRLESDASLHTPQGAYSQGIMLTESEAAK